MERWPGKACPGKLEFSASYQEERDAANKQNELQNDVLILITQHWFIAAIGIVAMVLNYLIALKADQELIEKFGDDYKRYMQTVPRMNFLLGLIRLSRCRKGE